MHFTSSMPSMFNIVPTSITSVRNVDYTSNHIPKLLKTPSSILFQLRGGPACKGPGGGYYERNIRHHFVGYDWFQTSCWTRNRGLDHVQENCNLKWTIALDMSAFPMICRHENISVIRIISNANYSEKMPQCKKMSNIVFIKRMPNWIMLILLSIKTVNCTFMGKANMSVYIVDLG